MSEMEMEMQELEAALAEASREKPCGCEEAEPFGGASIDLGGFADAAAAHAAAAELEAAFAGAISAEEELEFAALEDEAVPTLDGLLALAERYPGLNITLSFTR